MISVNSRLALAIRRTNAEYGRLPKAAQDAVDIQPLTRLERAIDDATARGDDPAAFIAIEAWERECFRRFEEATQ